ncbi:Basic helix-loop-helix protein A [Glycine soja]
MIRRHHHFHPTTAAANCIRQCLLKYILSTVPFLLAKNPDDGSSQTIAGTPSSTTRELCKEFSANHVLADRRHKKLNHKQGASYFSFPFLQKRGASDLLIIRGNQIERKGKCRMEDIS